MIIRSFVRSSSVVVSFFPFSGCCVWLVCSKANRRPCQIARCTRFNICCATGHKLWKNCITPNNRNANNGLLHVGIGVFDCNLYLFLFGFSRNKKSATEQFTFGARQSWLPLSGKPFNDLSAMKYVEEHL